MNHFNAKYFNKIAGAGAPKKPEAPPPPQLYPPKLGNLQAISSFEYIESVDLISDGPIDGLVNQNGEYLEDGKIFEGVYVNDAPIRLPVTMTGSNNLFSIYDLTKIGQVVSGYCYSNNIFLEKTADEIAQNINGEITLPSGHGSIGYTFINGKNNIAKDMYQAIQDIPLSLVSENTDSDLQQKVVADEVTLIKRSKFNYNSPNEVATYLLQDLPSKFEDEYPFFCLKLDININTESNLDESDLDNEIYSYANGDFLYLDSDIHNQVYLPLEATELNKRRFLESKRKVNITFPTLNGYQNPMYLFLYKENGIALKNSIDAVIKHIKSLKIIRAFARYNIANAQCELREGGELQRSLSAFNKTYSETTYSFKLIGPFAKGRPVLRSNKVAGGIDVSFDPSSEIAKTGEKSVFDSDTNSITKEEYDAIKADNPFFWDENGAAWKTIDDIKRKTLLGIAPMSLARIEVIEHPTDKIYEAHFLAYYFGKTIDDDGDSGPFAGYTGEFWFTFNVTTRRFYPNKDQLSGGKPVYLTVKRVAFVPIRGGKSYWNTEIYQSPSYFTSSAITNGVKKLSTGFVPISSGKGAVYGLPVGLWNEIQLLFDYHLIPSKAGAAVHQEKGAMAAFFDFLIAQEGSEDNRNIQSTKKTRSYSDWTKDTIQYTSQDARPLVHVVNNPNVEKIFCTIGVRVLRDIAETPNYVLQQYQDGKLSQTEKAEQGTSIPTIVKFKIECGYQDKDGNEILTQDIKSGNTTSSSFPRIYEIQGIADAPANIDIGREENASYITKYSRFIVGTKNIASPIELPPAIPNTLRFVRVTRQTYESYSSLIRREIFLEKISEIIDLPFSYPYSTVCGLKLDSRSASEIPKRSYDARFKKVFVPTNYFPLHGNGKDKRYLTAKEYKDATAQDKLIYEGNWDGTFKFAWTDNPVWILFDVLINRRYGLGNFIEPTQVNYWELYKIGRYCDAVDNNGYFVGVPSEDGYEPRYSFNGVVGDKTDVFDLIKTITASFRGNLFYSNSEINFTNDMLKPIMASFNNSNVKDGVFTYTNDRRDLQYNVIEVSFLDRTDLFKEKIEYVEDPDDIKNRGILRTSAQTFGVTSRAHAKRIGQHIIYSTINEDQNIQFVAGLDSLLCRPGDLISVNDELKTFKRHVGRVLEVDLGVNSVYTNINLQSSDFGPSGVTGQISVFIPTGKYGASDFYDLSKSPSKLSISDLYKNDVPMIVNMKATGTGLFDFGSTFYIDANDSGSKELSKITVGAPCSVTLSNTKQEVYKILSIKELNLNEYEIVASKFDTGKFAEIESAASLTGFFPFFPQSRTGQVIEGSGDSVSNQFMYQLSYPKIYSFSTGNYDADNDAVDFTGSWEPVNDANCYDVELITPRYRSVKKRIESTSVSFEDFSEVGQFTLKVTARKTGVYPNLISPTAITGFKAISYIAPIRNNGIVRNFTLSTQVSTRITPPTVGGVLPS